MSNEGVKVDDPKITSIKQWQPPNYVKQLRALLSLASYYRKFIKNFAPLAAPLTDLLKKEAFKWLDYSSGFPKFKNSSNANSNIGSS